MYETMLFGKMYHFTSNAKRRQVLHKGPASKCKRVHYTPGGVKI